MTRLYVWAILAGSSVGLLASTLGRLYSSTYYALRDTRTPLRYALVRLSLTTALGIFMRDSAAALARPGRALGNGGADGIGWFRRLGGVCSAAPHAESAHWPHWNPAFRER